MQVRYKNVSYKNGTKGSYKIGGLKLLGTVNYKTIKSQALAAYNTAILYLSPAFMVGRQSKDSRVMGYDKGLLVDNRITLCPSASLACRKTCLFISGARRLFKHCIPPTIRKAKMLFTDYERFFEYLMYDIEKVVRLSEKHSLVPCIRLNGTSDIAWEKLRIQRYHNIMDAFPELQFYDYTKRYSRMLAFCKGNMPSNYYLTFSRTEDNDSQCKRILKRGKNVSVPFRYPFENITEYLGHKVISGELSDLRFFDDRPCIVGLLAKARAKHDTSGFVVWNKKGG